MIQFINRIKIFILSFLYNTSLTVLLKRRYISLYFSLYLEHWSQNLTTNFRNLCPLQNSTTNSYSRFTKFIFIFNVFSESIRLFSIQNVCRPSIGLSFKVPISLQYLFFFRSQRPLLFSVYTDHGFQIRLYCRLIRYLRH